MSKGEVTRRRIVAAAAPIFNQRGFAGCSMQDVMEAAAVEKGGLYRHFSSKDELAVEVFKHSLAEVSSVRQGDSGAQGAVAKLVYRVQQFARIPSPIQGGCPLMNTAIDADDTHPQLRRLAKEAIQSWKLSLSRIVEDGIAAGEIREDFGPARLANVIVSTLEGALMISRLEGSKQAMHDAEETLIALIEGLARARSPRTRKQSSAAVHSVTGR